jgi:hypothetical protein
MSEEISLPPSELPQEAAASDADADGDFTTPGVTVPQPESPDDVPQEPSTEEEKNERRVLIRKVMRYRALFGSELVDVDLSDLGARPLEELRDVARDVEFLVSTRRSAKAVRGMFIGGVQVLETGGPYFGLELQGLTGVVAQSNELLETVDEAAVRHEACCSVDPVARIAIQMAQLILALDSHNRQKKVSALTPAQPAVPVSVATAETPATASPPIIKRGEYEDL